MKNLVLYKNFGIVTLSILVLNIISYFVFFRIDLTNDNRFTLAKTSINIINKTTEPIYVDVFLEGSFPAEFKRLQNETKQLLDEFKAENSNIIFQFVNPLENTKNADAILESFVERKLIPVRVSVNEKGKQTEEIILPWAIATYKGKSARVALLKNKLGATSQEKVVSSVQHLEYAFANAFNTITTKKQKKIAVIKGKNEMPDIFQADFLQTIRENYFIAKFPIDSTKYNPKLYAKALKTFDLALIAKPKNAFTDQEKQVLDQFIINGGKAIWLLDAVSVDMTDLNESGKTFAFPINTGLNDMFFKYGFRINSNLIKDLQATSIALATGSKGSQTQYSEYSWLYSPYIQPNKNHPITNNLDGLKLEFCNSIDILKNNIQKTVLLQSSNTSKKIGTPIEIDLEIVNEKANIEDYPFENANNITGVLLEGKFKSVFENRVLAFKDESFKASNKLSKQIVIADGDIIKNQLDKEGNPLELGFDKWTNKVFANKEFLLNCVNYLLDENGLINIRSKSVNLPLLDKEKVYENYTEIQIVTLIFPILILIIIGITFVYLRKRRYSK